MTINTNYLYIYYATYFNLPITIYPFQQSSTGTYRDQGTMEALRNIYRNKGIAGFWAGWQPKVRRLNTNMCRLSDLGMSNVNINIRRLSELGMSNVTIDLKLTHNHRLVGGRLLEGGYPTVCEGCHHQSTD